MINIIAMLGVSDKWDKEYQLAIKAAVRLYQKPDRAAHIIQKYVSKESRVDFNLVNIYSRRIFRHQLLMEASDMEQGLFVPGVAVMLATFADRDWAFSDRALNFDYDSAKQKIRNAMAGMNFVGVIEAGYYPGVEWCTDGQRGNLVSFHAHVVLWAGSKSKLKRHQQKISGRFTPVSDDDDVQRNRSASRSCSANRPAVAV